MLSTIPCSACKFSGSGHIIKKIESTKSKSSTQRIIKSPLCGPWKTLKVWVKVRGEEKSTSLHRAVGSRTGLCSSRTRLGSCVASSTHFLSVYSRGEGGGGESSNFFHYTRRMKGEGHYWFPQIISTRETGAIFFDMDPSYSYHQLRMGTLCWHNIGHNRSK